MTFAAAQEKHQASLYCCIVGPNNSTVGDFWRMVWQVNANRIVMVTNLVEAGKVKILIIAKILILYLPFFILST